jgi:hypothetical protein
MRRSRTLAGREAIETIEDAAAIGCVEFQPVNGRNGPRLNPKPAGEPPPSRGTGAADL